MDQGETWHTGRPWPWPHCVINGDPAALLQRGIDSPQFSAHIRCGQMAGWIKMPLGMDVGLNPGDFVTGTQLPSQKGGGAPNLRPMSIVPKRLDEDATWYGSRPDIGPGHIVLDEDPALPAKREQQPPPLFSALVYCGHGR